MKPISDRWGPSIRRSIAITVLAIGTACSAQVSSAQPATNFEGQGRPSAATADHLKFEQLKGPFSTGPEVTKTCLQCHTEAARQIHKTTHWTWAFKHPVTGQELGKKNVINNFCVATATNWPRCTSCHVGYGWKDDNFDFASEENVDCLICHADPKLYKKYPAGAGHPAYKDALFPPDKGPAKFEAVDLAAAAQSVGKPTRENCGVCHFYGGGGDGVKHGDLDSSMKNPGHDLDVHMDAGGLNFSCQTCHSAGGHNVTGSRYVTKAVDRIGIDVPGHTDDTRATCESCHGLKPHPADNHPKLNDHTDRVACTTCHVGSFARGGRKTKTWWDWSTAGKTKDGKPFVEEGADGYPTYDSMKGDFVWKANVVPEYYWYNGRIEYTLLGQKIDDTGAVNINTIDGRWDDPDSRIWPFKVMRGKQPIDKENKILAIPHLFGKDENAFWGAGKFDWAKAISAGMQARNVGYSGTYDFVETRYYWPVLHMVGPKNQAVQCNECHVREGRLASLTGFYMPGRDAIGWLTWSGWAAALLSLVGVVLHALMRAFFAIRERSSHS